MTYRDPGAKFEALVWPLLPDVARAARVLTGDPTEGEELAQETMVKAFRGIDGFAEGTNVKAWLMTILRNARLDRLRSVANRPRDVSLDALDVDLPAPDAPDDEIDPAWRDDPERTLAVFSDQEVIGALRQLPEEIRMTLLLVDVQGIDHAEAAQVLGVPAGTIKSRAHRGRAMLRGKLLPLARQMRVVG